MTVTTPNTEFGPLFVIAEAGVNHNGSPELAHQLIDAAADLGAHAIKFQTFDPALVIADNTDTVGYQRELTGHTDQREMLEALCLPAGAWRELASHAGTRSIEFMSTAFDDPSLDLLVDIGVERFKIPSGELTNHRFIRRAASAALPLVVSTGMGTLDEVQAALACTSAAPDVEILHCVSAYPAPVDQANLRCIETMRNATGRRVGWSDHCRGTLAAQIAYTLGARTFERHLTLHHALDGPDHAASDDPQEFANYLDVLHDCEAALGTGVKAPTEAELETRALARRSWHARVALAAGTTLTHEHLVPLRPEAAGVPVDHEVVGKNLVVDRPEGAPIRQCDLA